MFITCKPWPFGDEYHTVCCCSSGIMWGIDLVEGKDCLQQLGIQQYDNFGSTVGLLLRMLSPIYHKGFIVILDSRFCVLKGIIELRKKGVFASALIKKRRYWPKYIKGDDIKAHFKNKNVGDADSWAGTLDNIPFLCLCHERTGLCHVSHVCPCMGPENMTTGRRHDGIGKKVLR